MNLYTQISSGRFNDIYVGNYIVANNVTWLVADIDNYLYIGYKEGATNDGALTQHHATIIPASPVTTAAMNTTDTSEGGYASSRMKQKVLPNILSVDVEPIFKGHVLTYNTYLSNSISSTANSSAGGGWTGSSNGWAWYESKIDLMSEANVYGSDRFSSSGYDTGVDHKQYAIFQLRPEFIHTNGNGERFSYWLKNVLNASSFVNVSSGGVCYGGTASHTGFGVRPRFLIG